MRFNSASTYLILLFIIPITLATSCISLTNHNEQRKINQLIRTKLLLAQEQIDRGQASLCVQTLKPMIQSYPNNPEILNMIGIAYLSLTKPENAKKYFMKSFKIKPIVSTALNLSSSFISTGYLAEAKTLLKKSLQNKKYEHKERLLHNLGLAYEKGENAKKALYYYKKAINENPSYYLSYLQLGNLYKKLKQTRKSMEFYMKAIEICNTCIEPIEKISTLYINNGQIRKAKKILVSYLQNKNISKKNKNDAKKLLTLASKYTRSRGIK